MSIRTSFPTCQAAANVPGTIDQAVPVNYPRHPITFVVGFPRGGPVHFLASLISRSMRRVLGQRVIIQNRPGAAGNRGAASAAHAAPNGYTLYVCYRGNTMNQLLYRVLDVDMMRDFVPIGLIATASNVLVAHPDVAARTVDEFVSLARRAPGNLTFASAGPGSSSHLLCELFKLATQSDVLNIPYRGAGPALDDLLAGRVDAKFESFPSSQPHIEAGSLRPIAVAGRKRIACLPDTPTMEESGFAGFFLDNWYGLMAPAGTPSDIALQLNEALNCALTDKEVQQAVGARGYILPQSPNGPGLLLDLIAAEYREWKAIVESRAAQRN
nr:tripartite tricarboxylate transporter substrate-binding protein [Bordetella genomosp. 11]